MPVRFASFVCALFGFRAREFPENPKKLGTFSLIDGLYVTHFFTGNKQPTCVQD